MARRPHNVSWVGFTDEQVELLDFLDHLGNNGWDRNGQSEALMPGVLADFEAAGMTIGQIVEAMRSIGYSPAALHQLERWESKRTTGRFGR